MIVCRGRDAVHLQVGLKKVFKFKIITELGRWGSTREKNTLVWIGIITKGRLSQRWSFDDRAPSFCYGLLQQICAQILRRGCQ
jgi:hypothetical protein